MAMHIPPIPPVSFGSFKELPTQRNLKDRYWKFLFDNLQRAVDELYATCETDESIVQCKEVAMVLEKSAKDFHALIDRFKLLQEYEQAESGKKPSSLAWAVRTTVPVPKSSEHSPRRSARSSKKNILCIPPHVESDIRLSSSDEQPVINTVSLSDDQPVIKAIPLPNISAVHPDINKTNGFSDQIEEGEWHLVTNHKKNRICRKLDFSGVENVCNDGSLDNSCHCGVKTDYHDKMTPLEIVTTESSPIKEKTSRKIEMGTFDSSNSEVDMDLSIELDEALISALTAEEELRDELREELNDSIAGIDDQDLPDDQSDSWMSASVDSVRVPGRGVELHEKLLSPVRRNKVAEKYEADGERTISLATQLAEKQLKVTELRERRQKDKIERCALISKRVEEVKNWKTEILEEKKRALETKMRSVEQRRMSNLQQIVRKCHDEEAKGSEIAFINSIEAESRKQDVQSKYQLWRKRLLELADEQQKRRELAAQRKSAASSRKRAIDMERQHRMQELLEKQKEKELKAEKRQHEKLLERVASSRAREREHEERMTQLRLADEKRANELRKRIHHKQDECARRHSELIEQRREKALSLSTQNTQSPRNVVPVPSGTSVVPLSIDQRKFCSACQIVIESEFGLVEHLKSRNHRHNSDSDRGSNEILTWQSLCAIVPYTTNTSDEYSAPDSNKQSKKKRVKKCRQRLLDAKGNNEQTEIPPISKEFGRLSGLISELDRIVLSVNSIPGFYDSIGSFERTVLEIARLVEKYRKTDDFGEKFAKGISVLTKLFEKYSTLHSNFPKKAKIDLESADRLINATLLCFVPLFQTNMVSGVFVLMKEPFAACCVFEMLISCVESLAKTASASLRLGGPAFDAVHAKLVNLFNWAYCFFDDISLSLACHSDSNKINEFSSKEVANRAMDCVNLLVSSGLIDSTSQLIAVAAYRTELGDEIVSKLLQAFCRLLTAMCNIVTICQSLLDKHDESMLLIGALRYSDLSGVVSMIYALMLKETALGKPALSEQPISSDITPQVADLLSQAYLFLTSAAVLEPVLLQTTLSSDSPLILQFRQASAYVLAQANANNLTKNHNNLINQVIVSIGLFAVLNHSLAEKSLASGQPPTILQQLCQLPIRYFTDPTLSDVLLPSLIAIIFKCESCLQMLKADLSPQLLVRYLEEYKTGRQTNNANGLINSRLPPFHKRFPDKYWSEATEWLNT